MDEIRLGQISALEMAVAWLFAKSSQNDGLSAEEQIRIMKDALSPQVLAAVKNAKMGRSKADDVLDGFRDLLDSMAGHAKAFETLVSKI